MPRIHPDYDRASAEHYWGEERRKLRDEFRIVLSAGEPPYVNAAYHAWETNTLLASLKPKRGMRVLDLACGLGRVTAPLAATGATVVGVDNAFAMLRAARTKTRDGKGVVRAGVRGDAAVRGPAFDAVLCLGLARAPARVAAEGDARRVHARAQAARRALPGAQQQPLAAAERGQGQRAPPGAAAARTATTAGLVDRETLVGKLARAGRRVSAIGSNGHYAVLRHALHGRTVTPEEARVAAQAFAAATERDLADPDQGAFGATCADHFFYRIVRR
jgi:SAM-dependent methyltransferase